jgi:hypothetical protein
VDKRQCQAVTSAGKPCKARPLSGESFCLLHMPGVDPAAMGAIGGRARERGRGPEIGGERGVSLPSGSGPEQISGELSDREQALAALRRALDGGNHAAMVAAAKALLEFDHSPRERPVTVEDAREQLEARLNAIEDHRHRNGEVCSACGGSGIVARASRGGGGPRIVGVGVDLSGSDDQRALLCPSTREPDG